MWYTDAPAHGPGLAIALLVGQAVVVGTAAATLVVSYYARGLPLNARRALRPMMFPTIGWCASITASAIWAGVESVSSPLRREVASDSSTTFIVLPAVLIGALAAGVGWIDLTVRARSSAGTAGLGAGLGANVEQYLSRALADPSIRVLYPIENAEWVDATGKPAVLDLSDTERAATVIMREPRSSGIDQDAAITARPDAVELIATGAGLIMEIERLMANAKLDLEQARLLAERLLSASDGPRAQLRAELLAGPLAELDTARSALLRGAPVADVLPCLTAAAAQVRTISHGVFPPSLTAADCGPRSTARWHPRIVSLQRSR